ncbi:MAG: RsmD family RNA methyltransferase [Acidimicrobiales bacterium]
MRVIGGADRGRKLRAPGWGDVRPTSDRVREAIFDILESRLLVEGAVVLDLFAGSGALGIEALSRGAARVTFVESDPRAVTVIEENLDSLGYLAGGRAAVVRAEVLSWLGREPGAPEPPADVALADPPYDFRAWPVLLSSLRATNVVLEHSRRIEVAAPYEAVRGYRYGTTLLTLATFGGAG